jgi:hypothetical protein
MTPSPFDAARHLSDNRGLAMKQLALVSALALALSAAACGKSSDLRPLKEETTGMISHYVERVAALDQRRLDLSRRGSVILQKDDARPVKAQLDEVSTMILPGLLRIVKEAPLQVDAVEKDSKLDEPKKVAALRALAVEAEERLADGWLLANGKLDAVEVWVSRAEGRQAAAQPAPQPAGGASPQPTPTPTPAPEAGAAGGAAGDAAGAAGGTYPMGAPQQGSAAANAAK